MFLTDMKCRTATPKTKPYKLSDGDGLYLEVMPKGGKYWRQKYYVLGKEKRIAHGVYPEVSLSEAREKRSEIKEQLKQGLDPSLVRLEKSKLQERRMRKRLKSWLKNGSPSRLDAGRLDMLARLNIVWRNTFIPSLGVILSFR